MLQVDSMIIHYGRIEREMKLTVDAMSPSSWFKTIWS